MKGWVYGFLILIAIGISIGYSHFFSSGDKMAYFYNQKVFAQFEGKLHLEDKLAKEREMNKQYLDSLLTLIQAGRKDLTALYEERTESFSMSDAQLTEKYTAEIWKFINEGVQEYGAKNDYDFIFGATGDGSLMYAKEKNDVTNEVVEFINQKYGK